MGGTNSTMKEIIFLGLVRGSLKGYDFGLD
jgi:hypothetical protein